MLGRFGGIAGLPAAMAAVLIAVQTPGPARRKPSARNFKTST
jgi:hypothetical protein